ncbi:hypothetical protein B0A48_06040 [Cryoendolithus antarcticus]|uniref:Uncharacterized protein n=1 Tax=Cryoendolithus antarcticus TaxID=1507870 RepID=A0A1V8TCP2_9PEZI|nr:hypothetical protein B0A48_06040 [Cryoendolithus antarcticus]
MAHPPASSSSGPEAAIVQSFAADLDDMFGLDSTASRPVDVDHLSQTVNEKKQTLSTKDRELQELEARIRETEERLARVSRNASPARGAEASIGAAAPTYSSSQAPSTHLAPPQASSPSTVSTAREAPTPSHQSEATSQPPYAAAERPNAGRMDTETLMQGMPGALPQTPKQEWGGNGDYVMVEGEDSARNAAGSGRL